MSRGGLKNGVVLVLVLWAVALLSALAIAASASFRGFAAVISTSQDKAKADALLNAGLEAAAAAVGNLGDQPLTERAFDIKLKTGAIRLRLSDEAGRIDINKAPVKVIAALLRSAGADDADVVARAIDAARGHSNDAAPSQSNASAPAPAQNNANASPAGAASPGQSAPSGAGPSKPPAFTDVAQLGRIAGVTPDIVAAVTPLVTVFGDEKVNALTAPGDVLAALPNVSRRQIDAFLTDRLTPPVSEGQAKSLLGSAEEFVNLQKKRSAASVDISARLVDGYSEAASATIIVLPHDVLAYRVLRWSPYQADRQGESGVVADMEP
jgi:general secretion pathway protein K